MGYLRQQDRGSGAHSDRLATPLKAPLALIRGLDLRVDARSATPRPLCAQRRPAALRRCSLRIDQERFTLDGVLRDLVQRYQMTDIPVA